MKTVRITHSDLSFAPLTRQQQNKRTEDILFHNDDYFSAKLLFFFKSRLPFLTFLYKRMKKGQKGAKNKVANWTSLR